jgi:hypothetical protein
MDIKIEKVGASYVVAIPNFGTPASYAVRFSRLEDARELAIACTDWFSDCKKSDRAGLPSEK